MKIFLLALLVAAVAAAPKIERETSESVVVPDPVVIPGPALPEVVPGPVILPAPVEPEIIPSPIILPGPALPEVVPSPEIVPGPVILPEPVFPEVAPGPVILPELIPVEEPVIDEVPTIVEKPEIPTGEIFNDGLVQVTVNTSEDAGYLSTLQSWFSMIVNYFNNGVQATQHIV